MSEESGEDAPPRPKRKIKKVMVLSSSSSSDSDESVGAVATRKKRLRVVSDGEASDSSSGSSVAARRRRKLPLLRDSDAESDSSGWATDRSGVARPAAARPAGGFASDSSEGNSDKCSICLLRFTDQQIGTPENCEHIFCLDCITEWSKNVNTCPVDRATFNTIVVRACIGGRVLRTDPVTVVERPPSVDMLVIEDPTPCEICGSTSNEEVMLLCDNCDLGYHMDCLTPALHEIPDSQWFCPGCISVFNAMGITEMEDMMLMNLELTSASGSEGRMIRNLERMLRHQESENQPSTSSGRRSNRSHSDEVPTTSRGSRSSNRSINSTSAIRRRTAGTQRRKARRRKTRTVVIEYEVEENGKFPVTKRVKRKIKRRKAKKRQPRTVARRSHVRASVRAKLAASGARGVRAGAAGAAGAAAARAEPLELRRRAIAAPSLNLFGDPYQLDYFSDDENDVSEGATAAVAARPTSSILSAYRQARRKLVTIPSPPHATSAPDLLSNILESQTLLHSKNSIVSISVDGDVNIKLQGSRRDRPKISDDRKVDKDERDGKVDLNKADDAARKVPSYPGQSRGGGWSGGYRGNYHREQTSNSFGRGGTYDGSYGAASSGNGGGFQGRPGQGHGNPYPYQNNNMRRDEPESFGNYTRRPHQYSHNEDLYDRSRRPPLDTNRGPNYPNPTHHRLNELNQGRFSLGPAWQPYAGGVADSCADGPPPPTRHSFGGFENPLDMRVGQAPPLVPAANAAYAGVQAPRPEKPQHFRPLPEPPSFDFNKLGEVDKSEDERSDSGLVIDTEKYDPTDPTNDDDSGDEEKMAIAPRPSQPSPARPPPAPPALPSPPAPPALPALSPPALPALSPRYSAVQSILAGIDTTAMNVPPNVLDTAVRQVLQEHRNLIGPAGTASCLDRSDEDSDGDCPNFSIYSATSVHIANNTSSLTEEVLQPPPEDNLEDLVQEDDETPPPEVASPSDSVSVESSQAGDERKEVVSNKVLTDVKKKTEEEYKEKVSKRCPITTNTRNPIKIKLNTPSLMKRSVSLYDDDDVNDEAEATDNDANDKVEGKSEPLIDEPEDNKSIPRTPSPIKEQNDVLDKEENIENSVQDDDEDNDNSQVEAKDELVQKSESVEDKNVEPESITEDKQENSSDKISSDLPEKQIENTPEEGRDAEESDPNLLRKDKDADEEVASDTEELKQLESEHHSEAETDDVSADELLIKSPQKDDAKDNVEKLTESISENEDERSYTPCLDENKSKDNSFDTEKEKGIEGLDTEMISEEEGNEMFSESERPPSPESHASPPRVDGEDGEILDKKAKDDAKKAAREEGKKKKKKDSKKEGKDKSKGKKKGDVAFKKLSKSGKERNYRERDKDEKKSKKERRESSETAEERQRRRREKRKDLERYDVRTVVTEKRKKMKDPFGRDISPRAHSPSLSPALSPARLSRSGTPPPRRLRRSPSLLRRRSPSPLRRRSPSPLRRRSPSPLRRRSPSILRRRSTSPIRRRSMSPLRRRSPSPIRRRSPSPPRRLRPSPSPRSATPPSSPRRSTSAKRRSPARKRRRELSPRRRRSTSRARKRRRSADRSPKPKPTKKKKRARSERPPSRRRRKSPKRRRRRTASRSPPPSPPRAWTPPSVDSRLLSPRTPPPEPEPPRRAAPERPARKERRRRDPERRKRARDAAGPSKEVFTSGDNILVSVSFKDQERAEDGERRKRREGKRERRRRRRADPEADVAKPVAIIDLERSPFRELTPSPKNVIVLSDSDRGEPDEAPAPPAAAPEPAPEPAPHAPHAPQPLAPHAPPPHPAVGPKTPPEPPAAAASPAGEPRAQAPEPRSPDAYDPFEPTRSASASPAPPPSPAPRHMTLEAAQKTNMSADEVLDRRPLSPMEKVLALLQSTRDVSPEPPPGEPEPPPPAPRIVLPEPKPKLFPGKPSPIKSNPVKPMQQTATKIARAAPLALDADSPYSPYSPGSSDFGDLFEPPPGAPAKAPQKLQSVFDALFDKPPKARKGRSSAAKVPVKLNKKKGKTQVGVKIDEDNLKILDDLPSSAVEMQVKSKFLKKLNRQERVVEEVKLVLKPHYNKKHVTKEEYKDILRRAVPKICHNKTGEINPTKIQALVEAYVKKFRKKHKLGLA